MAGISRRTFLSGAIAAAGVSPFEGAAAAMADAKPNLVLGVLSDVHINRAGDEATFRKALEYFRDNGADGVVVAGDVADSGQIFQLELAAGVWNDVFPGGKTPDGRRVERLFVYGNHDLLGWAWGGKGQYKDEADKRARAIGFDDNRARVWERLFAEPYKPIWSKTVKGYAFIGAHWGAEKGLDAFLQENADRLGLRGGKPFFHIQHPHPGDTVQGPWAWGNDHGVATRALEKFPDAVAFSGHSHYSLTDERTIWQGAFTSVGTGSLKYIFAQYGRENGEDHDSVVKQMPLLPEHKGRQGMLVSVFGDRIVFARREFVFGESLGPDWVVPLDGTRPYAFAPRRAAAVAPSFAPDARVAVERRMGRDRRKRETDQIVVSFPAAKPSATSRVHDYEVSALVVRREDVEIPVAVKRVHSESFYLPPSHEAESAQAVFAVSELKEAKAVRFAVRPVECFGRKGMEMLSDVFSLA